MEKDKKKRTTGTAAAAAAASAAVGAAAMMGKDEEQQAAARPIEAVEPLETLSDGGELPEVTITGTAPTADGGVLPEVSITGSAAAGSAQNTMATAQEQPAEQPETEWTTAAYTAAEPAEEFDTAETPLAEPVEEEVFQDEFDDADEVLAQTETKTSDGGIVDEFIDKAEEILGISTEPDMPDFNNSANVNEFTSM